MLFGAEVSWKSSTESAAHPSARSRNRNAKAKGAMYASGAAVDREWAILGYESVAPWLHVTDCTSHEKVPLEADIVQRALEAWLGGSSSGGRRGEKGER